jgi:transcriptional regulator with PAS, ATPase and Fis domain
MTDTDSREIPLKLRMAAAGYLQKKRTRQEPQTLSEIKIRAVKEALSAFGNHRRKAAKRLGISEATLYRYLQKMKANNI